jgi:hypothetical protein
MQMLQPENIDLFIEDQACWTRTNLPVFCRSSLIAREGGRGVGGGGAKAYHGEEAWSSINNSILSGCNSPGCILAYPTQLKLRGGDR